MKGYTTLYNPGLDHAGIATQAVVENRLLKTEGLTRHDLGREKFLEKVWEWKDVYQEKVEGQFKRLGISADWNRVAFTLDEVSDVACGAGYRAVGQGNGKVMEADDGVWGWTRRGVIKPLGRTSTSCTRRVCYTVRTGWSTGVSS